MSKYHPQTSVMAMASLLCANTNEACFDCGFRLLFHRNVGYRAETRMTFPSSLLKPRPWQHSQTQCLIQWRIRTSAERWLFPQKVPDAAE